MFTSQITAVGTVTDQPRLSYVPAKDPDRQTAVVELTIETVSSIQDHSTGRTIQSEPTTFTVKTLGSIAEHVADSVEPGDRVIAVGILRTDAWTDRITHRRHTRVTLYAEEIGRSYALSATRPAAPAVAAIVGGVRTPLRFGSRALAAVPDLADRQKLPAAA